MLTGTHLLALSQPASFMAIWLEGSLLRKAASSSATYDMHFHVFMRRISMLSWATQSILKSSGDCKTGLAQSATCM